MVPNLLPDPNRVIKQESLCVQKNLGQMPVIAQPNQRRYNSHISNTIIAEIFALREENA
jgi:hypothetical protein